jgi:hypothetical protein
MNLLLDENLSWRMVKKLIDLIIENKDKIIALSHSNENDILEIYS